MFKGEKQILKKIVNNSLFVANASSTTTTTAIHSTKGWEGRIAKEVCVLRGDRHR